MHTLHCSLLRHLWQWHMTKEEQNSERSRRGRGASYSFPYTKFPWFSKAKST